MVGSGDEVSTYLVRTTSETSVVSTTSQEEITIPAQPQGVNLNLNFHLPSRQETRLKDLSGMYQYPIVFPVPVVNINNERCCCAQMIQEQQLERRRKWWASKQECRTRREENLVYMARSYPDPYGSPRAYQDKYSCPCSGIGTCSRLCAGCPSRYMRNWSVPKPPTPTADTIYLQRLYKSLKSRSSAIKNGLSTVRNQAKLLSHLLKCRTIVEPEEIPAIAGEIKSFHDKLEDVRQLTEDLAKPVEPPLTSRIKKELIDVTAEVRKLEEEMSKLQTCLEKRKLLGVGQRELMISERSVPSTQKKSTIKRAGFSRIASEMPPLLVEDSSVRHKSQMRISAEIPVVLNIAADSMASTKTSSIQSSVRSRVASQHSLQLPVRSKIAEGLHATTINPLGNVEEFPVCLKSTPIFSRPLGIAEAPNTPLSLSRITEMLADWSKLLSETGYIILPGKVRSRTPSMTSEGKSISSSSLEETSRFKRRVTKDPKITPTKLSKTEINSLLRSRKSSRIEEKPSPTLARSKSQIRPTRSLKIGQLTGSRTSARIDKISLIKTTPSNTENESAIGSRKQSRTVVYFPVESKAWAKTEDKSPNQSVSGEFPFRLRKPSRIEQKININSKRPNWIEGSPVISRTLPLTERSRTPPRFGEGSIISLRPPSKAEEEFPFMSTKASCTEPARRRTSSVIFEELPRSQTLSRTEEGCAVTSKEPSEIKKEFPVGSKTPSGTDKELPIRERKKSNINEGSLIRLKLPSRSEEEFPLNSETSLWTEEARTIRRTTSSTTAKEIPDRSRTPSRTGEEPLNKCRRPSWFAVEFSNGSITPSRNEEELSTRSRTPSVLGKVLPITSRSRSGAEESPARLRTPSRIDDVLPIRRRTPSIFEEELPIWSRTQSRFEDDLPIMRRMFSVVEEEFPFRRSTPSLAEEEIPIRPKVPSNVTEKSTIRRRESSRIEG